uniref:Protein kinase domain-containing protein n=1 Tax=Kalanchoe fedtschenkoi TaxID=63787 RepID=A0A7N0ZS22_KALFE
EGNCKRSSHSPNRSKIPDELCSRKTSGSVQFVDRSGSQSRSDVEDVDILNAAHKLNGKYANDCDNDMSIQRGHSGYRHGSRDRARDEERELSVNYCRLADRQDEKYAKEISDRDLSDGDVDRVRRHEIRREKEQKRSRTKELEKERSLGNNKDPGRQLEWDEGIEDGYKKGRETRTLERDRQREVGAIDNFRKSKRDRYWVKDRETDMDRGREGEISMERARDRDRGSERELTVERGRGNDQEKLSLQQTGLSKPSSEVAHNKSYSSSVVAKSPVGNGGCAVGYTCARGLGEGTPKSERSDDMFCDDIFGETPTGICNAVRDYLPVERSGLYDNRDDVEGYHSYRLGELLGGRYEITAARGKGVFSSVVRAKDLKAGNGELEAVAIKIIRNNETMFKAGQSELIILKKLVGADPEDRRALSLKHLRSCGVLHCDIKPDNMLVNESKDVLKLCDFGNARFAGKNELTPYLVSRFYWAPEITRFLGLQYDHPVDIWSIGCCWYEFYTGKVLFPGVTNHDMLRLHMELKGHFLRRSFRRLGAFTERHFDQDLNFLSPEDDPVTKKTIKRMIVNIKPKDMGSIITSAAGEDPKILTNFKDLLDKIFTLHSDERMTVSQALGHPFITGK